MKLRSFIVFGLSLIFYCFLIYPTDKNVSVSPLINHTKPNCFLLRRMFDKSDFTLDEVQQAISICKGCKRRAFNTLVPYIKKFGYEKSKSIADLFIQNGISVNDVDCFVNNYCSYDYDYLPLISAVVNKDIDAINFLISLGADVNKKQVSEYGDSHGFHTALKKAVYAHTEDKKAEQKRIDLVETLLKAGADPNVPTNESGYTLLMQAGHFYGGHRGLVYLLLMYGADPAMVDDRGKTFFDYVSNSPYKNDNPEVIDQVQEFINYIQEREFIRYILEDENLDKIKIVQNALLIAAHLNDAQAVYKLLLKGVGFKSATKQLCFNKLIENKPMIKQALEKYRNYVQSIMVKHPKANLDIAQLISEFAVSPL